MFRVLLKLFWTFFKIGLFTFGGGYAMIGLIEQETIKNNYLTQDELYQFIGISESTPGPFAVNISTFVGYNIEGGNGFKILASLLATLGVILPSFIIMLVISSLSEKLVNNKLIKTVLDCFKPAVIAIILAAGINIVSKSVLGNFNNLDFSLGSLIIFIYISLLGILLKEEIPAVVLIILAGFMGVSIF